LKIIEAGIHKLVQGVFDESVLKDMVSDGHETKVKDNSLNDNFYKKEFQELWKAINHKYVYTVDFDKDTDYSFIASGDTIVFAFKSNEDVPAATVIVAKKYQETDVKISRKNF